MNLSEPGTLRSFLNKHGLIAKKGLGQHFLVSSKVVAKIIERIAGCRGALEIGPGPGILTGPVSVAVERMIALEIDSTMLPALAESAPKAEIRQVDALKADLAANLQELPQPRAVVSNLPYYITAPLLTAIADARQHFSRAVLMMQREVGSKILAQPGNRERGSLSVFLQAQFEIRKVADVPKGAFIPPPNVESVVLELIPRETRISNEEELFALVRAGFKQPRKTLANNLSQRGREAVASALKASGLSPTVRPHELTLEQWLSIRTALFGNES